MRSLLIRAGLLLLCITLASELVAQKTKQKPVVGCVTDIETNLPLANVSVKSKSTNNAARTGEDGCFTIVLSPSANQLSFELVGYQPKIVKLGKDSVQFLDVRLKMDSLIMQEVTIKPKKYRNKGNPAVELIKLVIDNRDKNRTENFDTYQEEQYEKVFFGIGNVSKYVKNHFLTRGIRFVWDNSDTSKLDKAAIVPLFIQENLLHYYSKNNPKKNKKIIYAVKSVRFEEVIDDEGVDGSVRFLLQGADIYNNTITLFTSQFTSPIANGAPLLYRYYPVDTFVENGKKVVRLKFYPRNKADLLLQGDMCVVLDSTYPISHVRFTVNPNVNLDWVNYLSVEQSFRTTETGRVILEKEDYRMYFGLFKRRKMGMFGQRVVEHRAYKINEPLPSDTIFNTPGNITVLPGADRSKDTAYWATVRLPISQAEYQGYINMDSILHSPWYKKVTRFGRLMAGGYTNITPYFDLGPIFDLYAFNEVEGSRFMLTGRSTPKLSKRFQVDGRVQYGVQDARWKIGFGSSWAFPRSSFNKFPLHLLRFEYGTDIQIPGQDQLQNTFLGTSVVRGRNDRLLYMERYKVYYQREFLTNLSIIGGLERERLEAAGSLAFIPSDASVPSIDTIRAARMFVQLRFAPNEVFMQGPNGKRSKVTARFVAQVRYAHAFSHFLGGQYDYDEVVLVLRNRINTRPLGYNNLSFEAGALFGKAPYPLLNIHRANQSYLYRESAYNLMNFMEFISDRYVALSLNHYFGGFFLNRIPLIKKLKLREIASFKVLYGTVSAQNQPAKGGPGIFNFPQYSDGSRISYTLDKRPYMEAGFGVTNILKILRIDVVYRLNYLDHPYTSPFTIKGSIDIQF